MSEAELRAKIGEYRDATARAREGERFPLSIMGGLGPPAAEDAALALLTEHGRLQTGRPVPSGWRRRRMRAPGGCYEAAGRWSGRDRTMTYTEGIALTPVTGKVWIWHAWLTDEEDQVIDLGFEKPSESYIGIQIPRDVAGRVILKENAYGPVLPVLAEQGWSP